MSIRPVKRLMKAMPTIERGRTPPPGVRLWNLSRGLRRKLRNSHVRFLGEENWQQLTYPMLKLIIHPAKRK